MYKELKKSNSKRINNPINKWANELNRQFRILITKKTNNRQQMLAKMWGKITFIHCWWECELVQPLWKSV
jgi:hypothetical protein